MNKAVKQIDYWINPHLPEERRVQSGKWGFIHIGKGD